MARTAFSMPGPSAATKASARTRRGKGQEDVGDAHQHAVDPAAEIAGERCRRRGRQGARSRVTSDDDGERDARAVDDAAPRCRGRARRCRARCCRRRAAASGPCSTCAFGAMRWRAAARATAIRTSSDDDDEAEHRQRIAREARARRGSQRPSRGLRARLAGAWRQQPGLRCAAPVRSCAVTAHRALGSTSR